MCAAPLGEKISVKKLSSVILLAPQSQTSSSLGPPAPWRRTPEKPRRSAAARYRPGCPPTTGKHMMKTDGPLFTRKHLSCKLRHDVVPRAGATLSSSPTGWDVSPALHNTSPSPCRIFSWLPVTDKTKAFYVRGSIPAKSTPGEHFCDINRSNIYFNYHKTNIVSTGDA